ncbi:MAG: hypothetical protein IKR04_06165 [Clostridia bacterium]|nr:hypothetical protein [Clostridia bacterium]
MYKVLEKVFKLIKKHVGFTIILSGLCGILALFDSHTYAAKPHVYGTECNINASYYGTTLYTNQCPVTVQFNVYTDKAYLNKNGATWWLYGPIEFSGLISDDYLQYDGSASSIAGGADFRDHSKWVELTAEGTYTMHGMVHNSDGTTNWAASYPMVVYVDITKPTVTASNITYGSNLTATIGDAFTGLTGYALTTSATTPTSWTSTSGASQSLNFGSKSVGTYYVWAKDRAGNTNYKAVSVSKASGSASVSMANWTYGGTASNPSPSSSTNGTSSVTYSYSGRGSTSYGPSATKPSNAGDYTVTATFAATANYNQVTATANFTINKRQCTAPSITGWSGTYNGSAHYITTNSAGSYGTLQYKVGSNGTWTNGNPNTQSRTDVGTTTIYARRVGDSNNITSTEVNASIVISQANGYINLSATSGTVRYGTASKSFTVSSHHGGTLSVSDNHDVATCSVSGTTVTISNLSGISCGANESVCPTITITVTSAATTNYKQASATYTLKIIDDVAPTGSISVNNTSTMKNGKKAVKSRDITLAITYSDAGSTVDKMAVFEQTNNVNSLLENVSTSKSFALSTGDGEKTVYLVLRDTWGNLTAIPTN